MIDLSDEIAEEQKSVMFEKTDRKRNRLNYLKTFFSILALLSLFAVPVIFVFSKLNHFDPINGCYIRIKNEIRSENKDSIKNAILSIKSESLGDYKTLCQYVDQIYEENCVAGHKNNPNLTYLDIDGCYIKGTRVVYVKPEKNVESDLLQSRKNALIKYANESKAFWTVAKAGN